jgi:hypothetical protein
MARILQEFWPMKNDTPVSSSGNEAYASTHPDFVF